METHVDMIPKNAVRPLLISENTKQKVAISQADFMIQPKDDENFNLISALS